MCNKLRRRGWCRLLRPAHVCLPPPPAVLWCVRALLPDGCRAAGISCLTRIRSCATNSTPGSRNIKMPAAFLLCKQQCWGHIQNSSSVLCLASQDTHLSQHHRPETGPRWRSFGVSHEVIRPRLLRRAAVGSHITGSASSQSTGIVWRCPRWYSGRASTLHASHPLIGEDRQSPVSPWSETAPVAVFSAREGSPGLSRSVLFRLGASTLCQFYCQYPSRLLVRSLPRADRGSLNVCWSRRFGEFRATTRRRSKILKASQTYSVLCLARDTQP